MGNIIPQTQMVTQQPMQMQHLSGQQFEVQSQNAYSQQQGQPQNNMVK